MHRSADINEVNNTTHFDIVSKRRTFLIFNNTAKIINKNTNKRDSQEKSSRNSGKNCES
jgi:hypothetical protein